MKLDAIDLVILNALQQDSRIALGELAQRAGIAPSTAHERLKKLSRSGLIKEFSARLDHRMLGYDITAFIRLRSRFIDVREKTTQDLRAIPEVEEAHIVTGDYDLVAKVRARDTLHLQRIIAAIHKATNCVRASTEVCLDSLFERSGPLIQIEEQKPADEIQTTRHSEDVQRTKQSRRP